MKIMKINLWNQGRNTVVVFKMKKNKENYIINIYYNII
jgi:hypothetical protein